MKISNKLYQFDGENALLIISGEQEAELYIAKDGQITKKEIIKVESRDFSFKESRFQSKGKGVYFGGGGVKGPMRIAMIKEFLVNFKRKIKEIKTSNKFTSTYLVCPKFFQKECIKVLNEAGIRDIKMVIDGYYFEKHPFDFLEKIQKEINKNKDTKKIIPTSQEANKILKKKDIK